MGSVQVWIVSAVLTSRSHFGSSNLLSALSQADAPEAIEDRELVDHLDWRKPRRPMVIFEGKARQERLSGASLIQ